MSNVRRALSHVNLERGFLARTKCFRERAAHKSVDRRVIPETSSAARRVLLFGWDPMLLETRDLILTRHGYIVRTAMQLAEVERCLAEGPIHLLILCHSLDGHACDQALALAASTPATQSLSLISGRNGCTGSSTGELLNVSEGPEKLLFTIDKLLNISAAASQLHDS